MDITVKKDVKISFVVGFIAGLLLLPTLKNIGIELSIWAGVAVVVGLTIFTPFGYLVAYRLSPRFPVLRQFVKFGITGGLNSMIDLGTLNLLIHFTGITSGLYYSSFKASSFIIAVINSYFWNKYWTFRSEDGPKPVEFVKFLLVNLVGFSINVGTASLVVNYIGVPAGITSELWANIGAVSAVAITLFLNFAGMKFIVFKK